MRHSKDGLDCHCIVMSRGSDVARLFSGGVFLVANLIPPQGPVQMRMSCLLAFLLSTTIPAFAARTITVAELQQYLASEQKANRSDADIGTPRFIHTWRKTLRTDPRAHYGRIEARPKDG